MPLLRRLRQLARRWRIDRPKRPVRLDPLRPRDISNYKLEFPEGGQYFLEFLQRCHLPPMDGRRPPLGVVVMPWVSTPMPWYQVALGVGLWLRGRQVHFIWDDIPYPAASEELTVQNEWIARCLAHVAGAGATVTKLSQFAPGVPRPDDAEQCRPLAAANLTWITRARPPTEADLQEAAVSHACLTSTLPLVRSLLGSQTWDSLLAPGGVYGSSGLYVLAGRAAGVRVGTVDADFGVAQICTDGVAAQGADLPRAFAELWASGPTVRAKANTLARAELDLRQKGNDRAGFQAVGQTDHRPETPEVVLPLNVEWDSAALGRHHIFADTLDWVTTTLTYVLEHSAYRVAVRIHPAERRPLQHSQLNLRALVGERLSQDPRVRFIGADEPVNSYALLQTARVVLPFVSTIGIEAAALGKTVLVAGQSYYADLGFVWSATARAEYFELLGRALRAELPLKPDQIERAWLCYYLAAVSNRVWTKFTPHPIDFWQWCSQHPSAVYADPTVQHILTAIDDNIPLALVRHHWRSAQPDQLVSAADDAQRKG